MNRQPGSRNAPPRIWIAPVAVISGLVLVLGPSGGANAAPNAAYTLTATTSGISVVAFNEGLPLVQSVQVNAPSADATLNSRGEATAYSASPDPGQDFTELPSAAGAVCATVPLPGCASAVGAVPAYPTAYAQTGQAPQDVTVGVIRLHADAARNGSKGQSAIGASGAASATSTASTQADESGIRATADSTVDGLTLASYLKLTNVHSTATIHRDADGTISTSSSFELGSLSVDGQAFGFSNGSFSVLGQLVPIPVPLQTVLDALKAVGVSATYLPEAKTPDGITSAGLDLSYAVPAPPSGLIPPLPALPLPIGIGLPSTPTTVTYTLGRVSTTGTYKAIPASGEGVTGGPSTGPSTSAPTSATPTSSTPQPQTSSVDATTPAFDTGSLPSESSTGDAPTGTDAPAVAPQQQPGAGVQTTAARRPVPPDSIDIYLALVVAAFAAFGGATAIRFLGVRRAWTS